MELPWYGSGTDSELRTPRENEVIFERNDYTNSFYTIVEGSVAIEVDPTEPVS